jgi:hypothetical protein
MGVHICSLGWSLLRGRSWLPEYLLLAKLDLLRDVAVAMAEVFGGFKARQLGILQDPFDLEKDKTRINHG